MADATVSKQVLGPDRGGSKGRVVPRQHDQQWAGFHNQMAEGNQAKSARWLGVARATMREKLLHFGLHPAGEKPLSA